MSTSPQSRSSKAVGACSNCRKHQTRCEILDPYSRQCHRCEAASLACSHQDESVVLSWVNPISALVPEFGQPPPPTPSCRSISVTPPLPGPPYNASSPSSPGHAWSFIPQLLEWSAPMAAIQMLSERISPPIIASPILLANDFSIHDILSSMQAEHLLGMSGSNL